VLITAALFLAAQFVRISPISASTWFYDAEDAAEASVPGQRHARLAFKRSWQGGT
jgi:hypothetical protein